MSQKIDLGEATDDLSGLSDEQLDALLSGANTAALDTAAEDAYGDYLARWGEDIRTAMRERGELQAKYFTPHRLPRKGHPGTEDADTDPVQTAELIADILGGLLGEDALRAFSDTEAEHEGDTEDRALGSGEVKSKRFGLAVRKAWDELKHPRGAHGRFIPKGSAEAVASAKAGIDDIRKLGAAAKSDPQHAAKLAQHLAILTVKQLHELKREYGLKASGKLREELVAKIIDRLPGAQERIDSERQSAAQQLGLPKDASVRDIVEHLAVEAGYPEHFLTRQELTEKLDELGVSVPVQRGEAVRAAFEVLREGIAPKENPQQKPGETNRGEIPQEDAGSTGTGGDRAAGDDRAPALPGRTVAGTPGDPSHASGDRGGADRGESAGKGTPHRVPAQVEQVNRRLDRYEKHFRDRGNHRAADWMGLLRNHISSVGVETALESLGEEVRGQGEEVQYGGHELTDNAGNRKHDADFIEDYLDRAGISLVQGGVPEGERRTISAVSASSDEEGLHSRGDERDFFPKLQTLKHKLDEAQHLPGLERSEDLGKLMGGETGSEVTHLTPEVLQKLDDVYGKDQWIVKSYDDAAYAGFGIFFPQRARQVTQDARNTIWASGEQLARYGFSHLRDDKGRLVGIKHQGGDEYRFGTERYDETINGEVRQWGDRAAEAAASEQHTALPRRWQDTPTRYMAQPAFPAVGISNEERAQGVTFKRGGEGRTHIVTRNGKAELVPHSTWLKMEPLPVVFEDADTRAMAQAALSAINALPESERQGQIYAPDIMRTANGYKVVEANPSNEAGGSGYLGDNPLVMDAYVSHLTGREPAHVRFIRKLLTSKQKDGGLQ